MEVFNIAPADTRLLWLIGLIPIVVLVLVGGILGASLNGARSSTFEVSNQGLRIKGDWYGRLIPVSHLVRGTAKRVDFAQSPELTPGRRTLGTGMPGYQAGWFRLRNGDRALLYLTDRSKAVYVQTTEGYGVMVSPAEPDKFLGALTMLVAR